MKFLLFFVVLFWIVMSPLKAQDCANGGSVAQCAQEAAESAFQAKVALEIAAPRGMVMAFNLDECPDGWSEFGPLRGRVVVGAGKGDRLEDRSVGDRGGRETHRLTLPEMPRHSHEYIYTTHRQTPRTGDRSNDEFGKIKPGERTSVEGGNEPHNNMQPFYVLLYCERE